jgi:hypothetical protein
MVQTMFVKGVKMDIIYLLTIKSVMYALQLFGVMELQSILVGKATPNQVN